MGEKCRMVETRGQVQLGDERFMQGCSHDFAFTKCCVWISGRPRLLSLSPIGY